MIKYKIALLTVILEKIIHGSKKIPKLIVNRWIDQIYKLISEKEINIKKINILSLKSLDECIIIYILVLIYLNIFNFNIKKNNKKELLANINNIINNDEDITQTIESIKNDHIYFSNDLLWYALLDKSTDKSKVYNLDVIINSNEAIKNFPENLKNILKECIEKTYLSTKIADKKKDIVYIPLTLLSTILNNEFIKKFNLTQRGGIEKTNKIIRELIKANFKKITYSDKKYYLTIEGIKLNVINQNSLSKFPKQNLCIDDTNYGNIFMSPDSFEKILLESPKWKKNTIFSNKFKELIENQNKIKLYINKEIFFRVVQNKLNIDNLSEESFIKNSILLDEMVFFITNNKPCFFDWKSDHRGRIYSIPQNSITNNKITRLLIEFDQNNKPNHKIFSNKLKEKTIKYEVYKIFERMEKNYIIEVDIKSSVIQCFLAVTKNYELINKLGFSDERSNINIYDKIIEISGAKNLIELNLFIDQELNNNKFLNINKDVIINLISNKHIQKSILMLMIYGGTQLTIIDRIKSKVEIDNQLIDNIKLIIKWLKLKIRLLLNDDFYIFETIKRINQFTIKNFNDSIEFQSEYIKFWIWYKKEKIIKNVINIEGKKMSINYKIFTENTDFKKTNRSILANLIHSQDAKILHRIIHKLQNYNIKTLTIHDAFLINTKNYYTLKKTYLEEINNILIEDFLLEIFLKYKKLITNKKLLKDIDQSIKLLKKRSEYISKNNIRFKSKHLMDC